LGIRLFALVLSATTAMTACVETMPVSPDANTLVVHAVLDPGVQHQLIVIQATTGALLAQKQVTGAVVTIATPSGRTLTAVERRDTTAVTGNVPFSRVTTIYDVDAGSTGLIPGGTYRLRVVSPDGRTVTGQTTIPDAVRSTAAPPAQTIDRDRDTVSLAWPRVAGARSYQVFVHSKDDSYSVFADTSVKLPGTVRVQTSGDHVFDRGVSYTVAVIAVDENYFDYYHRTSNFSTATGLVMHLEGGIGVFGSVVTIATRTIVVR